MRLEPGWRHALTWITLIGLAGCTATPVHTPAVGSGAPTAAASSVPTASTGSTTGPKPSAPAVGRGEAWLAYEGGSGGRPRIRLVRPDGTGDHAVVASGVPPSREKPDWSPDGQRITFRVEDQDGTLDIWVVNADGTAPERIVDCVAPCAWTDDPAWSPDGSLIAYQQGMARGGDGLGVGTIEVIDLATRERRTLFTGSDREYAYSPRWSPDGQAIVLELDRFDSARLDASVVTEATIGTIDLGTDRSEFRPLLPWSGRPSSPDWNSDGLIVFANSVGASAEPGAEELFVIGADGTGLRQVGAFGRSGGRAIQPSWTPDGARIVFVVEDVAGAQPNIAFIAPDGSGLERVPPSGSIIRTHPRLRPVP